MEGTSVFPCPFISSTGGHPGGRNRHGYDLYLNPGADPRSPLIQGEAPSTGASPRRIPADRYAALLSTSLGSGPMFCPLARADRHRRVA